MSKELDIRIADALHMLAAGVVRRGAEHKGSLELRLPETELVPAIRVTAHVEVLEDESHV